MTSAWKRRSGARTYARSVTRSRTASRLLPLLAVALLATGLLAGCGTGGDAPNGRDTSLVLDFTPNAVHAGIYLAVDRGFDGAEGIHLSVAPPGATTDALKELLGGRADFAILDIHDLALARQKGSEVVGVVPLVQVPLAAVLTQPDVKTPKDLDGGRAGVTGLPSDEAVLDTVVRGGGGDPDRVKRVTIGFNAVAALVGGKVDAATAFWNVEGLAAKAKRPGIREFRVNDYGAPSYPELVIAARQETIDEEPSVVKALLGTLRRGYTEAISDPASAVSAMTRQVPGLNAKQLAEQLTAVSPSFTVGVKEFGAFNRAHLDAWSTWEAEVGITKTPPDVPLTFWFGGTPTA